MSYTDILLSIQVYIYIYIFHIEIIIQNGHTKKKIGYRKKNFFKKNKENIACKLYVTS